MEKLNRETPVFAEAFKSEFFDLRTFDSKMLFESAFELSKMLRNASIKELSVLGQKPIVEFSNVMKK